MLLYWRGLQTRTALSGVEGSRARGAPSCGGGVRLMSIRDYGFTRRELRGGSGPGTELASEHFQEMIGSVEFYIYRHPNRKIKGYDALKSSLESSDCEVLHLTGTANPVGKGYETIRVTNKGAEIPTPLLRRAHSWAHQRNLLHMFYKKG